MFQHVIADIGQRDVTGPDDVEQVAVAHALEADAMVGHAVMTQQVNVEGQVIVVANLVFDQVDLEGLAIQPVR